MMRHALGYRPDTPDQRDFLHAPTFAVAKLPKKVDLSEQMPPVMDQRTLGACVAHGTTAAFRYHLIKSGKPDLPLSRLMTYYDARALEGAVASDAGCEIRDALKSLSKQGACPESAWPYAIKKFATKPPAKCYTAAVAHEVTEYRRVTQNVTALKTALAQGEPVVIGISVYESFESDGVAEHGIVPLPMTNEALLGGHCLLAIGYDAISQFFLVRNSWGKDWGIGGNCLIPFDYLTNPDLASDFWTISAIRA